MRPLLGTRKEFKELALSFITTRKSPSKCAYIYYTLPDLVDSRRILFRHLQFDVSFRKQEKDFLEGSR